MVETMSRSNFRVKLDLCKFYHDVRRYCWIFIDATKIFQISHMKEHITKLFNIKEPFHLFLNETEYLPPGEDIRILKENETIVVSPGSGFGNELDSSSNTTLVLKNTNESVKTENVSNTVRHKESQTVEHLPTKPKPDTKIQQVPPNDVLNGDQSDVSAIDMTFHSVLEDPEMSSATESKATDSNITDFSMMDNTMSIPKKKRVRRRRSKKETPVEKNISEEENRSKKPKIINSYIISSGKHIRFDNGNNEDAIAKEIVHETSTNGCHTNNIQSSLQTSQELSNLLSLSQSSTPLVFTNRRVKPQIKVEHMSDDETKISIPPEETNKNTTQVNGSMKEEVQNGKPLLYKDLDAYPVMTRKPEIKDIITFKMLKIAEDYTPQVSEFIVAKVLSVCPDTSVYTVQILQGISEVQVPVGKFTIVHDEEESVMDDTITLNYAQIIDPRLVSTSK